MIITWFTLKNLKLMTPEEWSMDLSPLSQLLLLTKLLATEEKTFLQLYFIGIELLKSGKYYLS